MAPPEARRRMRDAAADLEHTTAHQLCMALGSGVRVSTSVPPFKRFYIVFVGTHEQYDDWKPA